MEPILAKGSQLLLSGFAEQICPCSVPHHGEGWHRQWQPPVSPDMKESKKDALRPPAPELGPKPEANGEPLAEATVPEKPEVELSNLVTCSKLAQSQASLQSASSVGSVRGDEGGAYSEFFGDYAPLFDNRQDPDNISLQGLCHRCLTSGRGRGRRSAGTQRVARAVAVPVRAPGQSRAGLAGACGCARGGGRDHAGVRPHRESDASADPAPRELQPGLGGLGMGASTSLHPQTGREYVGGSCAETRSQWVQLVLALRFASLGSHGCHLADLPH